MEAATSHRESLPDTAPRNAKLWGYGLITLAQFFLLLFLPYLFAGSSAEHIFGVGAYKLADFFINRLLGLAAFFIPIGFLLVGYYYLIEKQELGGLLRKLITTALWFLIATIFLLDYASLANSRLAGLFPRFFHALLSHLVGVAPFASSGTSIDDGGDGGRRLVLFFIKAVLFSGATLVVLRTYTLSVAVIVQNTVAYIKTWQASNSKQAAGHQPSYRGRLTSGVWSLMHGGVILLGKIFLTPLQYVITYGKHRNESNEKGTSSSIESPVHAGPAPTQFAQQAVSGLASTNSFAKKDAWLKKERIKGENVPFIRKEVVGAPVLDLTTTQLFRNTWSPAAMTEAHGSSPHAMTANDGHSLASVPRSDDQQSDDQRSSPYAAANEVSESSAGKVGAIGINLAESRAGSVKAKEATALAGSDEDAAQLADNYFGVRIINVKRRLFVARKHALADSGALKRGEQRSGGKWLGRGGAYSDPAVLTAEQLEVGKLLETTFKDFGIIVEVVTAKSGPVITCYELKVEAGVRLVRIMNLADNLALALAAPSVRIVAPIPGKALIGIEIPNRKRQMVVLSDIVESQAFYANKARLPISLGASILGAPVISDLTMMPHLLVAGATGSGKSVLINTLISSLILSRSPNELRFLMVDPKMVELNVYNGIPHLLTPVISDPKAAALSLKWLLYEMEARYRLLEYYGVRSLHSYHQILLGEKYADKQLLASTKEFVPGTLPYIVLLIDEFADLMLIARKDVEDALARLAAMSRAVGIHLILATQRPSVDVITGIIKANFPSRVAFQVSSKIDSRTIIDGSGAEKLLGKGDMLFQSTSALTTRRIQGAFLSDQEVSHLLVNLKVPNNAFVQDRVEDILDYGENREKTAQANHDMAVNDPYFPEALAIAKNDGKVSASYLQRKLRIGYNRAARIIEAMQDKGYISSANGVKPRDVLVS